MNLSMRSGGARNFMYPKPHRYPTTAPDKFPNRLICGAKKEMVKIAGIGSVQVGILYGPIWKDGFARFDFTTSAERRRNTHTLYI